MPGQPTPGQATPGPPSGGASPGLLATVYRSRAVRPLQPEHLLHLTEAARARNAREAVTGVMIYDDQQFFQWLEGPHDSVVRIMDSIRQDPRHTDIEVLREHPVASRVFATWSMKLAATGALASTGRDTVIEAPREVVETLRREPQAAPSVLIKLVAVDPQRPEAATELGHLRVPARTAEVLRRVLLTTVIPELARRHDEPARPAAVHPRVPDLAAALLARDAHGLLDLVGALRGKGGLPPLYPALFEPAARHLGDLWAADDCSEFEVTMGLGRLQAAVHALGAPIAPPTGEPAGVPRRTPHVLVAPCPGEPHGLGAVLDADVLRHAGWAPRCEYPDEAALVALLAGTWFDVLDLSLSIAFTRDGRMDDLARIIARARRASRNPGLLVLVGGRGFAEHHADADAVGADMAATTSLHVDQSILRMTAVSAAGVLAH